MVNLGGVVEVAVVNIISFLFFLFSFGFKRGFVSHLPYPIQVLMSNDHATCILEMWWGGRPELEAPEPLRSLIGRTL